MDNSQSLYHITDTVVENLVKSEQIDENENTINLSDDFTELKPVIGPLTSSPCDENKPEKVYDNLFDSVIAQSVAGTLSITQKPPKKKLNPTEAADSFLRINKNKSPTKYIQKLVNFITSMQKSICEDINEVTPYTSPFDDAQNLSKFLLQKPNKNKSSNSKEKSFHKRKSLVYENQKSKGQSGKTHLRELNLGKEEEKAKKKRKKSRPGQKILTKGVWVQCCIRSCLKWRFLQNCIDPSVIPEYWTCSMNKDDLDQNECTTPEIDWTECISNSQDHFVYSDYNEGSIVWAKMPGYPPWPAMVESDPDYNMFYEYDEDGEVLRYHVVFLDKNVSRAWIAARSVESYSDDSIHRYRDLDFAGHFKKALAEAISTADFAFKLSLSKRLEMYNFECRFTKESQVSVWNEKKHRSKKHHLKKVLSDKTNQQIVPENEFSEEVEIIEEKDNFTTELVSYKTDPDYWQHASDNDTTEKKETQSLNQKDIPEKLQKKDKKEIRNEKQKSDTNKGVNNKTRPMFTPTKLKVSASNNSEKIPKRSQPQTTTPPLEKTQNSTTLKPKFKPLFTAPKKSSFTVKKQKISSSPPSAVVPNLATEKDAAVNPVAMPISKKTTFVNDPFVSASQFTAIDDVERNNKSENESVHMEKENRNPILSDTVQCEVGSEYSEPINLSLQSTENLDNNTNISGSDFWLNANNKESKNENPFSDIEMDIEQENDKLVDQWEEEKLKALDEHMPPITDF